MAVELWPATLPKQPQKGYSESIGSNIIRSPMDAGPAKQRRRSASPAQLEVSWILSTTQLAALDTFIETKIGGGVNRFKFPHPRLSTYATQSTWKDVRMVPQGQGELYKLQYLAPEYWQVSTKLEVLP
jgi:hypothetical protein